MKSIVSTISFILGLTIAAANANAGVKRTLCVFDPSGAAGDAFNMIKDYRTAAVAWGVEFDLKPYTDEKTAAEDLKANKCHAAVLTGTRARTFNKFAGTIEAMGGLRSYQELKTVLSLLANPKAGKRLRGSSYETAAIFPVGQVYLHVRNRNWDSVSALAGKRIATLDFDEAAILMVDRAGAAMVPADVGTFAGMFNNGHVDAAYAPATAFAPLELEKGLRKGGGIIRYPLAQLTFQLVVRNDASMPAGFGDASRTYSARNVDRALTVVKKAEGGVKGGYWVDVSQGAKDKNDELFRQVRIQLRDKGVFDGTMLTLLRRIRCKTDSSRAECAEKKE